MRVVRLLALILLAGAACPAAPADSSSEALARGAAWLWSKQRADGGWGSDTYGLLGAGGSLTPFVLEALLQVPEEVYPRDPQAVARALRCIREGMDSEGALGRRDPMIEDYPNYATSLAVRAILRSGGGPDVKRMVAWLRGQQYADPLGWTPLDAPWGGWGMGGAPHPAPHPGHVDLSMTRYVIEALAEAGAGAGDPAFQRAKAFVKRCQNEDGGFFHSFVDDEINKGRFNGSARNSYGTATADGVLALLAMGGKEDEPRVRSAVEWLRAHHRLERVPGLPETLAVRWDEGMVYYYLAASAQAFRRLGVATAPEGTDWRAEMSRFLGAAQRADGSWASACSLMKEDDPLIATPLAVRALVAAR